MESFTWIKFCQKKLTEVLRTSFENHNIDIKSITLCKRQRDLKDGDIMIPNGPSLSSCSQQIIEDLKKEICEKLENGPWKISKITSPSFCSLAFHFDRQVLYKNILTTLWKEDLITGEAPKRNGSVMINVGGTRDGPASIEDARLCIIAQHTANLLACNGYDVAFVSQSVCASMKELMKCLGLDITKIQTHEKAPDQTLLSFIDKYNLKDNPYLIFRELVETKEPIEIAPDKQETRLATHSVLCKCVGWETDKRVLVEGSWSDEVCLDLKSFIENSEVSTGKGSYDKSFLTVCPSIGIRDGTYTDIMEEVLFLQNCISEKEYPVTVIRVNSDKKFYHQQKVDLICKALFGNKKCDYVHLNYGGVTSRQSSSLQNIKTSDDFIKMRFEQMKDAARLKYGEQVSGDSWKDTITRLTIASLKFEFLCTAHRQTVKLDLSEGHEFGGGVDNRAGSFVMYNCARLATLFKHFEENVTKGIYPPLPNIECIDFSTLREEDEWEIFYNFIIIYNEMILDATQQFKPDDSIISKIQTHKVANFLVSLSRQLSSYYSRTHILGENRTHLLPTMYARLYLMKVVHKIMCHALNLMGIQPLSQL